MFNPALYVAIKGMEDNSDYSSSNSRPPIFNYPITINQNCYTVNTDTNQYSYPPGAPFNNMFTLNSTPCEKCPSNPKNGGSGICFCTLGNPVIY